ncbi:MAG: FtsK/SpoIIIE domain-containing protein [Clostridium sp.]|uniref:FtsK/SpoIIIE domain-containing protein n=1 Tax=Clostridium sp. TaxID=1506 RepID=UPI003EE728F3
MKTKSSSKSIKSLFRRGKNRINRMIKQSKENEIKAKNELAIKRANTKKINELVRKWDNQMTHLGLHNVYADIFTLANLEVTEYGIKGVVALPDGMDFETLEGKIKTLEQKLECRIAFNRKGRRNVENIEFIEKMPMNIPFRLVKVKPWEICTGLDYTGSPMIEDMTKTPHMVNSGTTGSGKSFCIDHILINLIAHNSPSELELYLLQMEKDDMILYEDVKHCRAYATENRQFYLIMQHIEKIMKERSKKIAPYRRKALASSYLEYNKLNSQQPMSTIYVVIDEIASLFNLKGVKKEVKKIREYVGAMVERVAQIGRAVGVFLILSVQRPTVNMFSSFVKSMMNVTLGFKQENSKSSEVALDDARIGLALGKREFVVKNNGSFKFGIVPLMNTKGLHDQYLLPHKEKNHRDLFQDLIKQAKNSGNEVKIGDRIPETTREKVSKENENLLVQQNIKKIENYKDWDGNTPTQPKKGREQV